MSLAIVDSTVLMHYDNGNESTIEWWEQSIADGCCFYISVVTVMERLKGIANASVPREQRLRDFEVRIQTMKRERKIVNILPITKRIGGCAHDLIVEYCKRRIPPSERSRMEVLICDMLIAATALEKGILLFTYIHLIRGILNGLEGYNTKSLIMTQRRNRSYEKSPSRHLR
jgi:predicted nucleic acid-binding protein